jgi:hypothetical protein
MALLVVLILDALLLAAVGWSLQKDGKSTEKDMQGWLAKPVPVKVTSFSVWRAQASKKFWEKVDQHFEKTRTYIPKHGYVQL